MTTAPLLTEIDHVAIAVNDLDAAIAWYAEVFGATVDHREMVESDGVEEALLKVADSYVQLLTPISDDSPVAKYLANKGEGLHHVGYRVDDCAAALQAVKDAAVGSSMRPPVPAHAARPWPSSTRRVVRHPHRARPGVTRRAATRRSFDAFIRTEGTEAMVSTEPPGRPTSAGIDTEYLRDHQYKDPTNLHARVALHAKHTVAEQPWFDWVAAQLDWPQGCDLLEVGCGSGLLWANIASILPELHLTLTDISEGMLDAARQAVAPFEHLDLVDTRTCDAQELPFDDDSFDVVVANHMLYHVPDRPRAIAELARVLRPDGVLMTATNGPRHLEQVSQASREVFGWATMDFVDRRFGRSTGGQLLGASFAEVEWRDH